MHKSLMSGPNRLLITGLGAVVAVLVVVTSGAAAVSCAVGGAFGVGAGVVQARALRADALAFNATRTVLEVRRVLRSSLNGKLAIFLGWACAVVLLPIALRSKGVVAPINWFAGYLAFMLLRDLIAYPALRQVAAATPQVDQGP